MIQIVCWALGVYVGGGGAERDCYILQSSWLELPHIQSIKMNYFVIVVRA